MRRPTLLRRIPRLILPEECFSMVTVYQRRIDEDFNTDCAGAQHDHQRRRVGIVGNVPNSASARLRTWTGIVPLPGRIALGLAFEEPRVDLMDQPTLRPWPQNNRLGKVVLLHALLDSVPLQADNIVELASAIDARSFIKGGIHQRPFQRR
nr:hypothetical protein [Polymorphobacter glacialis]